MDYIITTMSFLLLAALGTMSEAGAAVCREGAFRCGDRCVPKEFVCDGYFDCGDGSDEMSCGNRDVDGVPGPPSRDAVPDSPRTGVSAPRRTGVAPRTGVSSPRPTGVAPRTGVSSPRPTGVAPRTGVSAPRTTGVAPRTGVSAPRTTGVAPRTGVSSPRRTGVSSPPREEASPIVFPSFAPEEEAPTFPLELGEPH